MPLVVPLDRLVRLQQSMSFDDAILEAALQDEPLEDRPQLRIAAIEALRDGAAALFLDALDETRAQRHAIVSSLDERLAELDPAIEVLLTTRHVAYADAQTLGFKELRVCPPEQPSDTVRAILGAVATERGVEGAARRAWIKHRADWIDERLGSDRSLRETPLMVVLLTMLTAAHDLDDLPTGRAPVLARVLADVITRWDAGLRLRGETPRLGTLEGTDATNAAHAAFPAIGHCIFEHTDPTREQVLERISTAISEPFDLRAGRAAGVAQDALALWDEAGVFVISGATDRVQARLRVFAELAEAKHIASLDPGQQRTWAGEALWQEDADQVVLLAAGLSPHVAEATLTATIANVEEDPLLAFIAEACRQHVPFDEAGLEALVSAVVQADGTDNERFQRAVLLLELPASAAALPGALGFLDRLHEPRRTVLRAISVEAWARTDEAVGSDLRAMTRLDPHTRITTPAQERAFVDPLYQRAVLAVANNMDSARPDAVARWLADRLRTGVAIGATHTIRVRLNDHGYEDLARNRDADPGRFAMSKEMRTMFERHAEIEGRLLEIIVGLAPPATLCRIQARRLDSLADLIETSDFGHATEREVTAGLTKAPTRAQICLRAAALLGGLDLGVVAAQAIQVREEMAEEGNTPFSLLWDDGRKLDLDDWTRIPDPGATAEALADAMLCNYGWIQSLALGCMESAPEDDRARAIAVLEAGLQDVRARTQWFAALGHLALARDQGLLVKYQQDERSMVRRASASFIGWSVDSAETRAALRRLLADDDRGVREESIRSVTALGLENDLRVEIAASVEAPVGWECLWCGSDNGAAREECRRCNLRGPSLAQVTTAAAEGKKAREDA